MRAGLAGLTYLGFTALGLALGAGGFVLTSTILQDAFCTEGYTLRLFALLMAGWFGLNIGLFPAAFLDQGYRQPAHQWLAKAFVPVIFSSLAIMALWAANGAMFWSRLDSCAPAPGLREGSGAATVFAGLALLLGLFAFAVALQRGHVIARRTA